MTQNDCAYYRKIQVGLFIGSLVLFLLVGVMVL